MSREHNFQKSLKPECPDGYILRESYTTRTNRFVPARCIRKVSILPGKAEERARRSRSVKNLSHKNVRKLSKQKCNDEGCKIPDNCPTGEILRSGYSRKGYTRNAYIKKDGTRVKKSRVEMAIVDPGCIKNRGEPGKGTQKIFIDPTSHLLSDFGYDHVKDLTQRQRRLRLRKLLNHLLDKYNVMQAYNTLIKELNGRAQLVRRTAPGSSKIFKEDQEWISAEYDKVKKNKKK